MDNITQTLWDGIKGSTVLGKVEEVETWLNLFQWTSEALSRLLIIAVRADQVEIINVLLKQEVNFHYIAEGFSIAVECGFFDIVHVLLKHSTAEERICAIQYITQRLHNIDQVKTTVNALKAQITQEQIVAIQNSDFRKSMLGFLEHIQSHTVSRPEKQKSLYQLLEKSTETPFSAVDEKQSLDYLRVYIHCFVKAGCKIDAAALSIVINSRTPILNILLEQIADPVKAIKHFDDERGYSCLDSITQELQGCVMQPGFIQSKKYECYIGIITQLKQYGGVFNRLSLEHVSPAIRQSLDEVNSALALKAASISRLNVTTSFWAAPYERSDVNQQRTQNRAYYTEEDRAAAQCKSY